jgi:hypothetical protein
MAAVPQRLEDAVGEAQSEDVLDRLLPEEMVHAEDGRLGERRAQEAVQRLGRREILSERRLDDEAASLRQAKAGHGPHRGLEHRRR